jgi:hypothetical protein
MPLKQAFWHIHQVVLALPKLWITKTVMTPTVIIKNRLTKEKRIFFYFKDKRKLILYIHRFL